MFAILLLLASPEPAELPDCDQAAMDAGVQQAMNICAAREFAATDADLNAQWRLTRAEMKRRDEQWDESAAPDWDDRPGYFASLLEAQRAWLTYRDAHCRSEGYAARGGSLEPLLVSTCKTQLTKDRTAQLRELAQTF